MKRYSLLFSFLLFTFSSSFADPQQPAYIPGGSVSPISLSKVLTPMPEIAGNEWWYFVSLLHDQNQEEHSLEFNLIRTNIQNSVLGIGGIGFTFNDRKGNSEYLWNFYPDIFSVINYPIAPLNYDSAKQSNFHVSIKSNASTMSSNFSYVFMHDPTDTQMVGQIGAHYNLIAQGIGEIGKAQNNVQYVKYDLQMTLQDKRGLVPEGFGGYVGKLNPQVANTLRTWEMAAPNLQAVQWTMTITPVGTITANSPVQQPMTFHSESPSHDRVWFDRQIENKENSSQQLMLKTLVEDQQYHQISSTDNGPLKQMYHGTWMSFCLNKEPFKNVCGAVAAFWNSNTTTATMNSDKNANGGFMNLFTPDSNGAAFPIQVGSTLTEVLSIQGEQKDLPYQIVNDPNEIFESTISKNSYSKVTYVKLRKNTLFSAIFDQISGRQKNKSYILKFNAISPLTENIMVSFNNGFYEGAAHVSLCKKNDAHCKRIGTGFIEQMGY